ncbi:sodium-and chloride-dependent glycine transporter 1 [Elysia marginata]|uniref:Sodium-and chloride-dependent glycine transporter 1 n=1 Tax=Elysia marginata TaxID=1093978 RepID=A0AAV4HI04_9GAST|nr:sodium-and chloride-dependent glycine transporter 1 [Elysia marginata]
MGKLCGRSRKLRNLTWLLLLLVYILLSQLPNFAMAPYLGNLYSKHQGYIKRKHFNPPLVGHYVYLLITQSMDKVRYPYIFLMGVGLLVVYVKQNFGLIERIVMGCWFSVSCIVCSAIWQYNLYEEWDKNSNRVFYDELSRTPHTYFPGQEWTWVSWALAAFPYVGIVLGLVHACFSACHRDTVVDEETSSSSVSGGCCSGRG